ncbi:hypothetical protein B0A48_11461 [Cryoendolithus antarcticus]|uniref:Glycoside hydrolase family 5 domain-containing protein n=1 Tax=Cryoendolithus antarcticus TaxID=1507870 RepID=A0A1V8SVN6_9PEZI|nr:hypothetical protein B0A48_11461 [Cryoendolithus antarcticus]
MKKFLNKAKDFGQQQVQQRQGNKQQPMASQPDGQNRIQPPTKQDVDRYRYHHGTNIGTLFILEKWLTGSVFPDNANGSAELAAAQGWVKQEGLDKARQRFETHWREYVSDADMDWLRDVAKCTSVRLPIGWFTLGPDWCKGTAFKDVAGVYQNAWPAVKDLVARLNQRGIATLIDLHGLPGGANSQEHSGTNSGKTEFWSSSSDQDIATHALCHIATETRNMDGVLGLQLVNESEANAKGMYDWYTRVVNEISRVDPTLPLYISDAWDFSQCINWTLSHNNATAQTNPIVIDTHLYWAFSDADKAKTPQQITGEASNSLNALDNKDGSVLDRGAVQAVVGEYSCVLTEDSWAKSAGTPKDQLVHGFGNAESSRFQSRAGGSFFWTYRMDWMEGGEWGFKQMTKAGAITPPVGLTLSVQDVQSRISHAQQGQQSARTQAISQHCQYWDHNHPGQYEHWRFEQGWDVGFSDAMVFFRMRRQRSLNGGDRIGMLELWVLKRLRESGMGGKFVWEFEQGVRKGVADYYQLAGI